MLPDLHIGFSRGRSGGLVCLSLSKFSTVYCDPVKGFSIVNEAEADVFLEFILVGGGLGKKIQTKVVRGKRKYFFLVELVKVLRSKESLQMTGKL